MVPDKERGLGLWLKRQREKEGYPSQRLLLDALARQGIKIHASAYATLESHGVADTPGKRKTVETIAAFYGVTPPDMSVGPAGEGMAELIAALNRQADESAVAAAIDRQTLQITRQADALIALLQRLDDLATGQKVIAEEVAALVDPDLARRRLAGAQNETLPGHSPRDPAQQSGPR